MQTDLWPWIHFFRDAFRLKVEASSWHILVLQFWAYIGSAVGEGCNQRYQEEKYLFRKRKGEWEEKGRQIFGEWGRHILALQSAKDELILLTVHLLARTCKDCRRQTPNISLLWYSAGSALCFRTKRQQLRLCLLMYCWKYCTFGTPFLKKHGQTQIQRCIIGNTVCRTLPDSLPVVPHNGESAALREQYFRYYLLPQFASHSNIHGKMCTFYAST